MSLICLKRFRTCSLPFKTNVNSQVRHVKSYLPALFLGLYPTLALFSPPPPPTTAILNLFSSSNCHSRSCLLDFVLPSV